MLNRFQRKLTPYSIDILNREYASGWCFSRLDRNSPARVIFRKNGTTVGETSCDLTREDLVDHQVHPTGRAGFECIFDTPLELDQGDRLTFHINRNPLSLCSYSGNQVLEVFRPQGRPIFFMHIPKTAGTSFNNYIRQYFGFGKSHTHIQTTPLGQQREMASSSHFLSGHITLEHIPAIFDGRTADIHTIVRHPLRQLHSHIGWVKGIALHPENDFYQKHHSLVQKMGRDLFQTDLSLPANLDDLARNLDGFQIDFFDNIQTRYFLDYRPDRVGQKDLDNALANLDQFSTIGLTEQFSDYTSRFCRHYGIPHKPITSVHNPSRVQPLFDVDDEATRKALMPMVEFDLGLYRRISAL